MHRWPYLWHFAIKLNSILWVSRMVYGVPPAPHAFRLNGKINFSIYFFFLFFRVHEQCPWYSFRPLCMECSASSSWQWSGPRSWSDGKKSKAAYRSYEIKMTNESWRIKWRWWQLLWCVCHCVRGGPVWPECSINHFNIRVWFLAQTLSQRNTFWT